MLTSIAGILWFFARSAIVSGTEAQNRFIKSDESVDGQIPITKDTMVLVRNAQIHWKVEEYHPVRTEKAIVQTALQAWTTNLKKKRHEGLDAMSTDCKRSDIDVVADDVEEQFVNPGVWMTQEEDPSMYLELLVVREIDHDLYEWMRISAVSDGGDGFAHFVFTAFHAFDFYAHTRFVLDKSGEKHFKELLSVDNQEFYGRFAIKRDWENGIAFGSAFAKQSTRWQSEIETSRDESAEVALLPDVGADKRIIKSVESEHASIQMTRDTLEWMKKIQKIFVDGFTYYPVKTEEEKKAVRASLRAWTANLKRKERSGSEEISEFFQNKLRGDRILVTPEELEKQFANAIVWMMPGISPSSHLLVVREVSSNLFEWMLVSTNDYGRRLIVFSFKSCPQDFVDEEIRLVSDDVGERRLTEISDLFAGQREATFSNSYNVRELVRVEKDRQGIDDVVSGKQQSDQKNEVDLMALFERVFEKQSRRWSSDMEHLRVESVATHKRLEEEIAQIEAMAASKLREERDRFEADKERINQELERSIKKQQDLELQSENLDEVRKDNEEIIRDLREKKKESEREITDLRSKLDTSSVQIKESEQKMTQCAEKQKTLEEMNAQSQSAIASLQDENTNTQRERDADRFRHDEQLQRANAETKTVRAENQAMKEKLQTEKQMVEALNAKVAENVESFSKQIKVLKSEKEAVDQQLKRVEAAEETLQKDNASFQEKMSRSREQFDKSNTEWKAKEKGHQKRETELTSEILESSSRRKMEEEANGEYDQLFFKQKIQKEEDQVRRRLTSGRESEAKLMAESAEKEIRHAEEIQRQQQMQLEQDRYRKQVQNDMAASQRSIQEDLESAARQITEREADVSYMQIRIQNEEEEARRQLEDTIENEAVLMMERAERDIRQIEEREALQQELNLRQQAAFHSKTELRQKESENEFSIIVALFIGGGSLVVIGLVIFVLVRGAYNEMSDIMITIGGSSTGTTGAEANGEVGVIIEIPDDSINAEDGVQGLEEDRESGVSGNEDHL